MTENLTVTRRDLAAGMAGMGMLSFVSAMGGMAFAGTAQAAEAPAGQPAIEEIQAAEIAAAKAENRRLDPVKYVTTLSHSELEDMLATEAEVTEDYVTPNGKVIPAIYVALRNRINRCGGGIGSIVSGDDHWDVYMNFWTEDDARHTLEMPMNKWFIANEYADKTGRTEAEAAAAQQGALNCAVATFAERFGLSPREREVLTLLAQGWSRERIGDQLGLAEGSVGTYCARLYKKMRVHGKQELLTCVYNEVRDAGQ